MELCYNKAYPRKYLPLMWFCPLGTFPAPRTSGPTTPWIWEFFATAEDRPLQVVALVRLAEIVIFVVVVDPLEGLALPSSISPHVLQFVLSSPLKTIWGLGWQVGLLHIEQTAVRYKDLACLLVFIKYYY